MQWYWDSGSSHDWIHSIIFKKKTYCTWQLISELTSCCRAGIWQKSTKYVVFVYNTLRFTEDSYCRREITECAIFSRIYIKANLSWLSFVKPLLFEWKLFVNNVTNFSFHIAEDMKFLVTKISHHLGAQLLTIRKYILE